MKAVLLDEVLALDALCLRDPSGGPLDLVSHRTRLEAAATTARFATVRRHCALVGYGYIWPLEKDRWFAGGLSIHPDHRNASVTAELFRNVSDILKAVGAIELESHVLIDNAPSVRLHRRLGFTEIQRDARAVAYRARVADLSAPRLHAASDTR